MIYSSYKLDTSITSLEKQENNLLITFEKTNIYPGGGGQPRDNATISNDSFKGELISIKKDQNILKYIIKPIDGNLKIYDPITIEIDKKRRDTLSMMHTGEHILYKSLETYIKDLALVKINLDTDESSLFVSCKNLDWNILKKAELLTNKIIKEAHPLIIQDITKDEAAQKRKLRIKIDKIKSDKIRTIEIKDFDLSACKGTHLKNTDEVKNLFITRFSLNHGKYEIRFKINALDDMFTYASITKEIASILETDIEKIIPFIKKIIEEKKMYKEKYRNLQKTIPIDLTEKRIGNITFRYGIFDDIEKKKMIDTLNDNIKEKTICCLIKKENDKTMIILGRSEDIKTDISKTLKIILEQYEGKGGGRPHFAQGSIPGKFDQTLINTIIKILKESISKQ